jgi:hypothetical protein
MKLILLLVTLLWTTPIFAHEHRMLSDKYELTVGFVNEPAFSGQMNGIDLGIESVGMLSKKPVDGIEKDIKATVSKDGKSLNLDFHKVYGKLGHYAAYFLPTQAGQYTFRIQGQIDGVLIDEEFISGPGRFHDVQDSSQLRLP